MTTTEGTPELDRELHLREHLTSRGTWMRGLHMVIFAIIYSVAEVVLTAVVVFQFATHLFTGRANERLVAFGRILSVYLYRILLFLTYNTEDRPFPFAPWPKADEAAESRPL